MATDHDNQNPETKTRKLTLRSSDGRTFVISESAAVLSVVLKNMVEDTSAGRVIPLPNVDGETLANVIAYLNKHGGEGVSEDERRQFDREYLSSAKFSVLFDVMLAANYLNIECLLHMAATKAADIMKNKSVAWVRQTFGIENDLAPEEEEEIKHQYGWAFEGVDPDDDEGN